MTQSSSRQKLLPIRKILTIGVQTVIIGLLIWFVFQNREVFGTLRNVTWQIVLAIIVLELASFLVNSYLNYSMIKRLDPRVPFLDCFMLQYVNNMLNKILPTVGGGAAFRAIYLKQKYQFPYSKFTSTVAGLYVVSFFSTSLIAIACLTFIFIQYHVFNWIISIAFMGIFLVTASIIILSPEIPESKHRIIRVLKNVVDGWDMIKKAPRSIILYTILSVILLLLHALQNLIIYQALWEKIDFVGMIYLSTLGIIMAFLNFTPDGIGVKEGIFIFSKDLVRIPDDILVLGSFVLRGISIITTFSIAGISYWILLRQMKQIENHYQPVDKPNS